MNFYDNIPNFNNPNLNHMHQPLNPMITNNNINQIINELELRIKKLELRISQLENDKSNNNYVEPDNSMYMI